jgi:hypothetical protein
MPKVGARQLWRLPSIGGVRRSSPAIGGNVSGTGSAMLPVFAAAGGVPNIHTGSGSVALPSFVATGSVTHDVTGLPLDANGFHDLQAIVDANSAYAAARFIYVDPTLGNNATAGPSGNATDHYARGAFANMFAPSGSVNAYATVAAANSARRANTCDVILLRRGRTFTSLPSFDVSGSSLTARAIIAAYGTGARPAFTLGLTQYISSAQYAIIADLNLTGGAANTECIQLTLTDGSHQVRHLLFENLYISGHYKGFVGQNASPNLTTLNNIVFHRNIFYRNAGASNPFNSQAMFNYRMDLSTLDQNIFIENGWDGVNAATKDVQSRHVYVDDCVQMLVRENVMIRPASEQIQFRSNAGQPPGRWNQGTMHNNLMLDGHLHVLLSANDGDVTMTFSDNVVQGTNTVAPIGFAGKAIQVEDAANVLINRNMLLQSDVVGVGGFFQNCISLFSGGISNVVITNNYINQSGNIDLIGAGAAVSGVTVSGNRVSISSGSNLIEHNVTGSGITGNQFYGGDAAPFRSNGTDRALAAWQSASGASGNTHSGTALGSPLTIESYLSSQGLTATLSAYMTALLAQDRTSWDSRLEAGTANAWFRAQVGGF